MTDEATAGPEQPDYVRRNREYWDGQAAGYVAGGRRAWALEEPTWGVYGVPESELHLLPDDLAGKDVVELGCGTAYVSAWLARRGARPVGIDNSPEQLATARSFQQEFGLEFPLHLGNAEATPFADASFDLAISEYGASIWCDPHRLIPETARILRPGGELLFLVNGTLFMLTVPDEDGLPATDRLLRPYFGMHRFEWPDGIEVDFHLGFGDWIRLLRANGFEVEDFVEVRPPESAHTDWPNSTIEWARRWPIEEVWKARKVR
jgi:SAM-dependent methyltransferase